MCTPVFFFGGRGRCGRFSIRGWAPIKFSYLPGINMGITLGKVGATLKYGYIERFQYSFLNILNNSVDTISVLKSGTFKEICKGNKFRKFKNSRPF